MNVNEVIANRAIQLLGLCRHTPLDTHHPIIVKMRVYDFVSIFPFFVLKAV